MNDLFIWAGILLCISQSATFSGLNLAMFGVSRLRLEVEASAGNEAAAKVLALREDSNFLLTTILWGNVGVNCLLTLLSDSVLIGIGGFLFSTFAITLIGEIAPQAYFSRNAIRMAAMLSPVLRMYQVLLFPLAKPCAMVLDAWLGEESILWFREQDLRRIIRKHIESDDAEVDRVEGVGALNFLSIDDQPVSRLGEDVDPASVVQLELDDSGDLVFPPYESIPDDPFLQRLQRSGRKWVILTGTDGEPRLVLDADGFLRDALFRAAQEPVPTYCHRPIVIREETKLGAVIGRMTVRAEADHDHVIDQDILLVWSQAPRIITGADILGQLLRGIVLRIPKQQVQG